MQTATGNILIARLVAALMKCGSLPPKELGELYSAYRSEDECVVKAIRAVVRKCDIRHLPRACMKIVKIIIWFFENEKELEGKKEIDMKDLKKEFVICSNCGNDMELVINSTVSPDEHIKYRCVKCGATRELTGAYVSPEAIVTDLLAEIDDKEETMNFVASAKEAGYGA